MSATQNYYTKFLSSIYHLCAIYIIKNKDILHEDYVMQGSDEGKKINHLNFIKNFPKTPKHYNFIKNIIKSAHVKKHFFDCVWLNRTKTILTKLER